MINAIGIALSGLAAATKKADAAASNIANAQTVGSTDGSNPAYTPITTSQQTITDSQGNSLGVRTDFVAKEDPTSTAYYPYSPFADENGLVTAPNVDYAEEAVNLKIAAHTYKANLATIKVSDEMTDELLKIFDEKV